MKPCLIKQPAGIGDIFFCQKIARYMMHHGYDVINTCNVEDVTRENGQDYTNILTGIFKKR